MEVSTTQKRNKQELDRIISQYTFRDRGLVKEIALACFEAGRLAILNELRPSPEEKPKETVMEPKKEKRLTPLLSKLLDIIEEERKRPWDGLGLDDNNARLLVLLDKAVKAAKEIIIDEIEKKSFRPVIVSIPPGPSGLPIQMEPCVFVSDLKKLVGDL